MTDQTTTPHRSTSSVPWADDAAAVGAAVVCALVLWGCAVTWGGVDLEVETGGGGVRPVTGPAVGVTAALAAAVGLLTLRGLERVATRARGWWAGLVVVATLVSLARRPRR